MDHSSSVTRSSPDEHTSLAHLRVDHVGSLLRPKSLIEAFLAYGRSEIALADLECAQDAAIREVVAKQEAVGLPVVSDGEYRRLNWQVSFSLVEGWDLWEGSWKGFLANPTLIYEGEKPNTRGKDAVETFRIPASSRLALKDNFPLREYRFLQSVAKVSGKAMLMGPDRVAQMCDIPGSAPHYSNADELMADVVDIQRQMVGELIQAGCPYVQLDEPSYTGYVDRSTLERMKARGEDPMRNLSRAIKASNDVIETHRGKATFSIHICRGNRASMWHREGTYDGIAEYVFDNLNFDRLLLEYDTDRSGGFEPLRYVPKGPVVVLGLITTKIGGVETVDALLHRIEDAQRFIEVDQLALSPQCGFASGISGNLLTEDEQWRKLEVMLETARRVWG
jgi:5-methyltetrahydropteroyltriglutamate--homocysteine methyltransferase